MFSAYFGDYSTLYLTLEQLRVMGRNYGTDLIVPNFHRQHSGQEDQHHHQQQQQLLIHEQLVGQNYRQQFIPNQQQFQHHYQDMQSVATSSKSLQKKKGKACSRQKNAEKNTDSSSEIKFSIDRILSKNNDVSNDESSSDVTKEDEEEEPCPDDTFEEKASTDELPESLQYDWLQCTRYKPPKLQRKFSYSLITHAYTKI